MHAFSRGSVHIGSSDPLAAPIIDNRTLNNEVDLNIMAEAVRFMRKVAATGELAAVGQGELLPGTDVQSDEQLKEWIRKSVQTLFHPIGTSSMLPQEDGGVVDSSLKVYGTDNVRVVSAVLVAIASLIPMSRHVGRRFYHAHPHFCSSPSNCLCYC
jgi:choline dehydrogenase-like flavoprotein